MLIAITRYAARVIPNTEQTIDALRRDGPVVQGPHLHAFETAFAADVGAGYAVSASFGRMPFYLLDALRVPPGSEIIVAAVVRDAVAPA
jgi:dTDP-4-amino-4,6-dideoxygalactose transaminase